VSSTPPVAARRDALAERLFHAVATFVSPLLCRSMPGRYREHFRSMETETVGGTPKTIIVGYDGTAPAEHALRRAAEYARAFVARVVVVSVAAPQLPAEVGAPGAFGLAPYYAYPAGDADPVERDEQLWQQHRERVRGLFADADLQVEFAGVAGEPAEELVAAAEQRRAELIIVGTREPGFLERLVGGSVSRDVARRAHCDVLVVHPDGG
jgi:nucleotide-binding universal stress UspA family protein